MFARHVDLTVQFFRVSATGVMFVVLRQQQQIFVELMWKLAMPNWAIWETTITTRSMTSKVAPSQETWSAKPVLAKSSIWPTAKSTTTVQCRRRCGLLAADL